MAAKVMQTQLLPCLATLHRGPSIFPYSPSAQAAIAGNSAGRAALSLSSPLAFLSLHSTHTDLQNTAPFSAQSS